jgi:hypothetical protein
VSSLPGRSIRIKSASAAEPLKNVASRRSIALPQLLGLDHYTNQLVCYYP